MWQIGKGTHDESSDGRQEEDQTFDAILRGQKDSQEHHHPHQHRHELISTIWSIQFTEFFLSSQSHPDVICHFESGISKREKHVRCKSLNRKWKPDMQTIQTEAQVWEDVLRKHSACGNVHYFLLLVLTALDELASIKIQIISVKNGMCFFFFYRKVLICLNIPHYHSILSSPLSLKDVKLYIECKSVIQNNAPHYTSNIECWKITVSHSKTMYTNHCGVFFNVAFCGREIPLSDMVI